MNNGLFVTGTDTGIGKTVVAAGLLRWLRRQGVDAVPMKPVETGVVATEAIGGDLRFCLKAAGLAPGEDELADMGPFQYEPACSPHLAGRLAGAYPDIETIVACARRLADRHELVIVEGAGGVIVPLNESQTMLDLMDACRLPVVLVARSGLGTINHTLLSLEALRSRGLNVLGVVFNDAEPGSPSDEFISGDNPASVERFGHVRTLGRLPRLDGVDEAEGLCWDTFDANMTDLNDLLESIKRNA